LTKLRPVKKRCNPPKNTRKKIKFLVPFKSAYVCFSLSKQNEVSKQLGQSSSVDEVAQRLAQIWKNYNANERLIWEKESEKDRIRYEAEKLKHNGAAQADSPEIDNAALMYYLKKMLPEVKGKNPSLTIEDIWKNSFDNGNRNLTIHELESRNWYESGKGFAERKEEGTNGKKDNTSNIFEYANSSDKPCRKPVDINSAIYNSANASDSLDNYIDLSTQASVSSNLQRLVESGRFDPSLLLQGADINMLLGAQSLHRSNASYVMNSTAGLSRQMIHPGSSSSITNPAFSINSLVAHSLNMSNMQRRKQLQSQNLSDYFLNG